MAKKISVIIASLSLLIMSGCAGLTNLTPEKVPENASRLYTLSMSAHINDGTIVPDSIEPFVVIDEQIMPMKRVENMAMNVFMSTIISSLSVEETLSTTSCSNTK